MINAASKVGDASHDIMYHVEPDSELDSAYKVKHVFACYSDRVNQYFVFSLSIFTRKKTLIAGE